jgi:hypothetical protein
VVVGAQDSELGDAGVHAALELLQAPLVDGAERLDLHRAHPPLLMLSVRARHRADSNRRRRALQARALPLGHGVVESPREESNLYLRVRSAALFL